MIVDEYSRELLSNEVARSITAEDVVRDLERLVRDWIEAKGFKTCFIEPGSPLQNVYIERLSRLRLTLRAACGSLSPSGRLNSRFRDEFLNLEVFGSLLEAKMLGEEHRYKYNHRRPHSTLDDLTPAEFASRCPSPLRPPAFAPMDSRNQHQPQLS